MRIHLPFLLLLLSGLLSAQSTPPAYELKGVYPDAGRSELHFLIGLAEGATTGFETGYTAMTYIHESGDTLVHTTEPNHWMPSRAGEVAVYSLPREFTGQASLNGALHLRNPDTVLSYSITFPDETSLPLTDDDCGNMEIQAFYESHNPGELAFLLGNRKQELGNTGWGYMTYHLENAAGDTVTLPSGPSYNPTIFPARPQLFVAETSDPDYRLPADFEGVLVTTYPDCRIPVSRTDLTNTHLRESVIEFRLQPNPVADELKIVTVFRGNYAVHSVTGERLLAGEIVEDETVIDVSSLNDKVLLVSFFAGEGVLTRKVVRR